MTFEWLNQLYSLTAMPVILFGVVMRAIDVDYFRWLQVFFQPVVIFFLLPILVVFLVYLSAVLVNLYKLREYLLGTLVQSWRNPKRACMRFISIIWDIHGSIFHGYEIKGLEKLPKNGPAYIVYYHGTLPIDIYYFIARLTIVYNRIPVPVVDRFLFSTPGLGRMLEYLEALPGSVDQCSEQLQKGSMLLLSPGGAREALFADEYYSVVWGRRIGFAKVAIKANVPIYPMFSENSRDIIRVVQYGKSWFQRLYEKTRLPIALFYGYFPVKLRTYIGDPIYPDSYTAEELADLTRQSMEYMIRKHQLVPGNIIRGILQRFTAFDKWLKRDLATREIYSAQSARLSSTSYDLPSE